jgi:hypothetical protein
MRKSLAIIIIFALILSTLPIYHSTDVNKDNSVDLRDVIIEMKKSTAKCELSGKDNYSVRKVLEIVSELSPCISTQNPTNLLNLSPQLDIPFLPPSMSFISFVPVIYSISKIFNSQSSYYPLLSTPPPRRLILF